MMLLLNVSSLEVPQLQSLSKWLLRMTSAGDTIRCVLSNSNVEEAYLMLCIVVLCQNCDFVWFSCIISDINCTFIIVVYTNTISDDGKDIKVLYQTLFYWKNITIVF